jgi:hypothetical protein
MRLPSGMPMDDGFGKPPPKAKKIQKTNILSQHPHRAGTLADKLAICSTSQGEFRMPFHYGKGSLGFYVTQAEVKSLANRSLPRLLFFSVAKTLLFTVFSQTC